MMGERFVTAGRGGQLATPASNRIGGSEENIEKGRYVVRRGADESWFEWLGGSGLMFWRWPK